MNRLLTLSDDDVMKLCEGYDKDLYDLAIRTMGVTIDKDIEPDEVLAMALHAAFAAGRRLEAEGYLKTERSE